jgi:hypothetical protein
VLRFLLDIHIDPAVAAGVRRHRPGCPIVSLRHWQEGAYRTASDATILEAGAADSLTLVTYDSKTIPLLLRGWAQARKSHAGVIFIDDKTNRPNDIGTLARSLVTLWDQRREEDWGDRVMYLRPPLRR